MSVLPIDEWDPELFVELETLLLRVSSPQTTRSTVQRLFQQLDKAVPWLLTLTQLPSPSDSDKQDTQKNAITSPSGTVYQVSGELLQATIEVSSFLSISHRLAANLIIRADQQQHNYVSRERGEVATYLLYSFLAQLLDFLHELIRLTIGPEREEEEPFITLRVRVEDLLQRRINVGSGEGTLVDLILSQLDVLQKKLDDLVKPQRLVGAAYDLLAFRVKSIRAQQTKLVSILALIAKGGHLGRGHVVRLLKWLKKVERPDSIVMSLLALFYIASQPVDSIEESDLRLENAEEWCRDVNFLKIASNLVFVEQWACPRLREAARLSWSLFIVSTLRYDPNAGVVGIDPHLADTYLTEAVNGDAFQFLYDYVVSKQDIDADEILRLATTNDTGFLVLPQLQGVIELLSSKKHFLRNLRNREEDNSNRRQTGVSPPHFSRFIDLVAAVFEQLPLDSAQYLWDDAAFTSAVLDGRNSPSPSVWHLLAVISTGPISAPKAFERLQGTSASPFAALQFYQHYTSELPKLVENIKTNRERHGHKVREEDVNLGIGLTRVLGAIVKHSPSVRIRLLQNKPNPTQLLFEMLNCEWDLVIKSAVLDALAAFSQGGEVTDEVYNKIVDNHDRVSFPEGTRNDPRSGRQSEPHGWLKSLETAEEGDYPLSRAYIRFLTTLLSSSNHRVILLLRRSVDFVLRQIGLLGLRRFAVENERWHMLDEGLAFVERALIDLDLSNLIANPSHQAWRLFDLPGFAVLLRLLENEVKIFPLLAQVIDSLPTIPTSPATNSVRLRVLRVYHRILDIQLVFADVLLPALERPMPDKTAKPFSFRRPANLEPLDLRLLNHLSNVTTIALWVNDGDLAVALLSTKIIAALAVSPHFNRSDRFAGDYHRTINRLAGFIDASDESIRIAQAFCNKLEGSGIDLTSAEICKAEEDVLRGVESVNVSTLPIVIRSVILDMLLDGTAADADGPNIAHFLLGFELKGHHFTLQNPQDTEARFSCLQVLLSQLRDDLIIAHPIIAAKSVELIHQLFAHPATGKATMAYATSIESFSATQLRLLPPYCPESHCQGKAEYPGGSVDTTAEVLTAYLNYQKCVISCVALELHAFEGKTASVDTVASELFGNAGEDDHVPVIIQILENIDVIWREACDTPRALEYYAQFNFDLFKQANIDRYDVKMLRKALFSHRQEQVKQGKDGESMEREAEYLIKRLEIRNHETEINAAKGSLLSAWTDALKVGLGRLFSQYVSEERQEAILFELLDALLVRLDRDISPGVLDLLSESIVVVVNTLRSVLAEYDGVNLPVDQLSNLLSLIINVIVRPGSTENTRGNLYAALSQYFSLVSAGESISDEVSVLSGHPGKLPQRATIAVLLARKDRFLSVLCKDAMDMRDIWKTECFALLGAISSVCQNERDRLVLSPLNEYLPLFVRSLKDREIALQECLSTDAESLHAYWVFEAKVSFFLSIATTRKGADDLLNAGLFEILSSCSFVAAEPYAEDTPEHVEAVSRQHRVLLSILQLLSRVLASLYKTGRSGAGHALGFINAHRDSLILLLRQASSTPSSINIDESRLIVSILAMIVHKIPENDRRSYQGFGSLHLAVVGLAARFLEPEWAESPEDASSLEKPVLNLNQVILSYLCNFTTGLKAGEGYPVFLNGATSGISTNSSGAPSLHLAVQALEGLVEKVQSLGEEYEQLAERVQHDAELSQSEMDRLARLDWIEETVGPDSLRQAFSTRWQILYNMIESLLLLIWRHSLFYANGSSNEPIRPNNLSISLTGSTVDGRSGIGQLRQLRNMAAELRGVLERLGDVREPEDLGRAGEQSRAYFGMLLRRLSELTAGLCGEEV